MSRAGEQQLFHARDAYSSAILLALLVLSGQLVPLAAFGTGPQGVPLWVRCALTVTSSVVLMYLVATRKRPQERAALAACVLLIVPYFAMVPWSAVRWAHLGRPWEAFAVPQIAMISVGLTVPRSPRLAVAAVLAFLLESIGSYIYFILRGVPRWSVPVNEPGTCMIFAAVGVAVVLLRRQRRDLVLGHLRAEAEVTTLSRLSSVFSSVVDRLGEPLKVLSLGFGRLAALGTPAVDRARAAVTRLEALADDLKRLPSLTPTDAVPPPSAKSQAPVKTRWMNRLRPRDAPLLAEPPRLSADVSPALSDTERQFYARDAQESARILVLALLVAAIAGFFAALQRSQLAQLLFAAQGVLLLTIFWILHRTRARPSERRGVVLYLASLLPFLVSFVYVQQQLARGGSEAFEPLNATKVAIVVLALTAPRHRWLGLTMIFLAAFEGCATFYLLHFDALRDRIPMTEPWSILSHVLVAVGLLIMREQRRVATLGRLRADREATALIRQAGLLLALLDQMGSPLQIIALFVALVRKQDPNRPDLVDMEQALQALVAVKRDVPNVDRWTYGYVDDSFDGASQLRPHPSP